jgi:hypothetical protein
LTYLKREEKHVKTRRKINVTQKKNIKINAILGVKINVTQNEEPENKYILINKLNIKYNNKSFYYYV